LEASKAENDITICSIYVNPTQFNNPQDLLKYPRTYDGDLAMLQKVGCDILFSPRNDEMYPDEALMTLDFGPLDKVMEGHFRPGHFSGVALVVAKLFNIVEPDKVYFGQKDWQQFTIIKRMVQEMKFNLLLRSVSTTRESDGLALSSRNLRLKENERKKAPILFEALNHAKEELIEKRRSFSQVSQEITVMFEGQQGVRLEYFELADSENLKLITDVKKADQPIICVAAYVGEVRLIDNMLLKEHK
jgi:pantoate--beta-alanine ligase